MFSIYFLSFGGVLRVFKCKTLSAHLDSSICTYVRIAQLLNCSCGNNHVTA
jgi:hypothetical protein